MKTVIVYASVHHGNTQKLVDAIAGTDDIAVIDAAKQTAADLTGYDCIGFASGIYFSKFHKTVLNFAENSLPERKDVFFLYSCGSMRNGYTKAIAGVVRAKSAKILGEYGCLGFNTFGPLKMVGGMAKGHPTAKEIEDAVAFYRALYP